MHMTVLSSSGARHFAVCCALVAGLAAAGCAISVPQSAEVDGSGVSSGPQTRTVSCGSLATLDRYVAGSGDATIQVTDGTGKAIYDQPANVTGEINDQVQLTGAPGTWTLNVDANVSGQFKITLQCL